MPLSHPKVALAISIRARILIESYILSDLWPLSGIELLLVNIALLQSLLQNIDSIVYGLIQLNIINHGPPFKQRETKFLEPGLDIW